MKVILYMAVSLNGFIARKNYEEDFLSNENWRTFVALVAKTGCMIWGRKTDEVVNTWGEEYAKDIKGIQKVIVSNANNLGHSENYIIAKNPKEAIELLGKLGFSEIILSGGSKLNRSFAKEGLINELIINIEPIIIGEGIPIFAEENFDIKLKMLGTKEIKDNLIQLHYEVIK